MVSKTSIKGSLEYTFSSNYIGYTNSFEGFIQINYKQNARRNFYRVSYIFYIEN